jgi:hypothetical protein
MPKFSLTGLLGRFAVSFVLVLATYNPTDYSFCSWVAGNFPHIQPLQAVIGIVLLGLWLFFLHATWQSLGTLGVALGLAFFAAVLWLLSSWGWLNLSSHGALVWAALTIVACMLTIGLSWSFIRVRVSGQEVVEEVRR